MRTDRRLTVSWRGGGILHVEQTDNPPPPQRAIVPPEGRTPPQRADFPCGQTDKSWVNHHHNAQDLLFLFQSFAESSDVPFEGLEPVRYKEQQVSLLDRIEYRKLNKCVDVSLCCAFGVIGDI